MTAPQFGYAVPPAYSVHNRIPETEPFLVRPNRRNALIVALLPVLVAVAAVLIFVYTRGQGSVSRLLLLLLSLACVLPLVGAGAVWRYFLLVAGGPRLGAGPAGIWVRLSPLPRRVTWLPWEAVERVYLRRIFGQRAICVKPRPGGGPAARSGYTVPAWNCDRPVPEILTALAGYSAGRAAIDSAP